jgi:cytochrome c oxidase assembly protein subunit 15
VTDAVDDANLDVVTDPTAAVGGARRSPTFRLSPQLYQRICLVALIALAFIVVTGGAVRVTDSGLGCTDWPTCEHNQFVASLDQPHAVVEFGNRIVTGVVSLAVIAAVLGSLFRDPRRRDLVWLSLGLVAGVIGQAVLGGISVLFELAPPFVMAHFLLSMVLVANAVVLEHRAGQPDGPPTAVVDLGTRRLGRLLVVLGAAVLFTGTVVTGAGPHGGDVRATRLPLYLPDVARVHSVTAITLLIVTVVTLWRLQQRGAPRQLDRRAMVLVAAILFQGAIGYAQYFTGVPPLLVGIHILGATVVWSSVLRVYLAMWSSPAERPPEVALSGTMWS